VSPHFAQPEKLQPPLPHVTHRELHESLEPRSAAAKTGCNGGNALFPRYVSGVSNGVEGPVDAPELESGESGVRLKEGTGDAGDDDAAEVWLTGQIREATDGFRLLWRAPSSEIRRR